MDLLSRPALRADQRISYGADPSQFGDLWLPAVEAGVRSPLVVFLHGGWLKSAYDLSYAGGVGAALKGEGIATWSIEYRRVGHTGGGWPATFRDAADGFDFVAHLAKSYPLDLSRLVVMGHSAGGHLAFWIAGRHHIREDSELFVPGLDLPLRGAIALAGAVDLRLTMALSGNSVFAHVIDEVHALMGGSPEHLPARYAAGDPGDLLPLKAAQYLIQGTDDDQIPPDLPHRWAEKSREAASHVTVEIVPGADHFAVVDPETPAWNAVLAAVQSVLA